MNLTLPQFKSSEINFGVWLSAVYLRGKNLIWGLIVKWYCRRDLKFYFIVWQFHTDNEFWLFSYLFLFLITFPIPLEPFSTIPPLPRFCMCVAYWVYLEVLAWVWVGDHDGARATYLWFHHWRKWHSLSQQPIITRVLQGEMGSHFIHYGMLMAPMLCRIFEDNYSCGELNAVGMSCLEDIFLLKSLLASTFFFPLPLW